MTFHKGQKVEIFRKSDDESWGEHMDQYVGRHGIITDTGFRKIACGCSTDAWFILNRRPYPS